MYHVLAADRLLAYSRVEHALAMVKTSKTVTAVAAAQRVVQWTPDGLPTLGATPLLSSVPFILA